MTRLEIETQAYRMLDKNATSPDTETQARMRGYLQNRMRRVLSLNGMDRLRAETFTFASVANQDRYGLPIASAKVNRIVDRLNYFALEERDMNWLRVVQPNPAPAGTPQVFVVYGQQAVQQQPADASELFLQSTAAGDTQVAFVEGFLTGGVPRSVQVTLTGVTAVSVSASITTWEVVTKVYLASAAAGVVSLKEDSGTGTVLAQIPIGRTSSMYQSIILWPTPSSVRTYTVDVERMITDLAQNTDTPPWPEDFHDILPYGICADECLHMDDDRRGDFEAQFAARLRDMKMWLWDNASNRPGVGSRIGWSDLGPWFPPSRWL